MLRFHVALFALFVALLAATAASVVVLDNTALLPSYTVWSPVLLGAAAAPREARGYGWDGFRPSPAVPEGWTAPDYDDVHWARVAHPMVARDRDKFLYMSGIAVRAKFHVDDPARAKGPALQLAFRGGVVVYLNGVEVGRRSLPDGPLSAKTLAEDYPDAAFADATGAGLKRTWDLALPADKLRRGTNVLAIEVHRSTFLTNASGERTPRFATAELTSFALSADEGSGLAASPNPGPALRLWNAEPVAEIDGGWYGDDFRPLGPMTLVAPRNGAASGVVVLGGAPVAGLAATASALATEDGKARIPVERLQVRHGARTIRGTGGSPSPATLYDVLAPTPQADPLAPIWLTVTVPADAAAGEYRGTLTVRADGLPETKVPVCLTVAAWQAPSPNDFLTHVGLIETPESLAFKYKVPLWSEKHWSLVEQSLHQMGLVGADVAYVPLIVNTHLGNSQTMVQWVKNGDGYALDYRVMDRYLDLWQKEVGTPQFVCLYVWDFHLGGQSGSIGSVNKGTPMGKEGPVPVSGYDPKTGEVTPMTLPPYGEPGSEERWQPVIDGILARLKARGIGQDRILLGHGADSRPNIKQLTFWAKVAPFARWVLRTHTPTRDINGFPVAVAYAPDGKVPERFMLAYRGAPVPGYGRYVFPRDYHRTDARLMLANNSPPFTYRRVMVGGVMQNGVAPGGSGGVGVDFWGGGPHQGFYGWNHLGVYCAATYVLYPGPDGPLPTVRLEMMREGLQEADACKMLFDALGSDKARAMIGPELEARAKAMLDAYTYITAMDGLCQELFVTWEWQRRSAELFALAGEVQAKLKVTP